MNSRKDILTYIVFIRRLSNIEGARMIYDKYAESQERGNCCPVCVRDFKDEEEVETFKAQLDTMRNFIPGKIADLNDQLKKILSRKEKLENVSETWVKWETLNNDLVSMKEIMDQLTAQKEEAVNKADVVRFLFFFFRKSKQKN